MAIVKHYRFPVLEVLAFAIVTSGCDQLTSRDFSEFGRVRPDTIELSLVRLDTSANGAARISSGIPLQQGAMQPGNSSYIHLLVGNEEQSISVRELDGRFADGSLRSIVVEFEYPLSAQAQTPARLIFTPTKRRSKADIPAAVVSYSYKAPVPQAVALPASPEYLIGTGLVGPTVPVRPAFNLQYENIFATQSDLRWRWFKRAYGESLTVDQAIQANYYDRAMFHWAWWVRTGRSEYWVRAAHYLIAFRELYLKPNKYLTQPHNWQIDGLVLHYLLTGDPESRHGVAKHAESADVTWMSWIGDVNRGEGRIQERALAALLAGYVVGLNDRDYEALLRTALNKILATQKADGSYGYAVWCGGTSNFMVGLLNDVLIRYFEIFEPDPRIPASVKRSVDWLWNTQWNANDGAFNYVSVACQGNARQPAPDLNLIIVNSLGWLYQQTGERRYRQFGDIVFNEGVTRAWIPPVADQGDKQFNQNYRSAFRYLYYRK